MYDYFYITPMGRKARLTPGAIKFIEYYTDTSNEKTFFNVYQSKKASGYSRENPLTFAPIKSVIEKKLKKIAEEEDIGIPDKTYAISEAWDQYKTAKKRRDDIMMRFWFSMWVTLSGYRVYKHKGKEGEEPEIEGDDNAMKEIHQQLLEEGKNAVNQGEVKENDKQEHQEVS